MSYGQPWKHAPAEHWEPVTANLARIKVPGGWLYRTTTVAGDSVALIFVREES